jgi:RND family efflux transporter MFP subunit
VDIGDTVRLGEIIAELDDEEFVQELEQARADLLVSAANIEERQNALAIAERDYERITQLHQQRIASESELDAVRSRYQAELAGVKVAEAELARREATVRAAEVRLSYTKIHATWERGGPKRVVGERFVDEGATVAANTPIVSLLDLDTLTAVVFVTERDYLPLRIGMQAELTSDAANAEMARAFTGRIVRMSPAFREGSRQARVEIEIDNPDHLLKPGMFVRAHLETNRDENAMIIPRRAFLLRDGVEGVFVVDRGSMTARFVPVTLGIRDRERVQVIDGEEDLTGPIVVLGQHLLHDGMAVTIPDDDEAQHVRRTSLEAAQ